MSTEPQKFIRTIKPGSKPGVTIEKDTYQRIKNYMLQLLQGDESITVTSLISVCHEYFEGEFKHLTGWYIYNVKLDLEARGLINHQSIDKRRLKKKNYKSSNDKVRKDPVTTTVNIEGGIRINETVSGKYEALFLKQPLMVHAPGRINLIGEHTDYNLGYVMPLSIDKGIQVAIGKSDNNNSLLYSIKFKQFLTVDTKNFIKIENSEWQNYFLGIIRKLHDSGFKIKPFNCVFDGDLPSGAGLSSSAALGCGFILALKNLFDLPLSQMEMIEMAQWAEHHYVGVRCGIMDQFASVMGKENHAILLDCKTMEYEYLPLDLGDYCLLLCDTKVKHLLASSEYNTRRTECEECIEIMSARYPDVKSLRDVCVDMLWQCKDILPEKIFNRCQYVLEENQRVLQVREYLKQGNLDAVGKKLYESHEGLSNMYEVSCAELDFLVSRAKEFDEIKGSRMMGGGFGGCTLSIIKSDFVGAFINAIRPAYLQTFGKDIAYYVVKTGDGASIL